MKLKSKTLGLIFGSVALGTAAVVPAVVLSSCAEDSASVGTTVTLSANNVQGIATALNAAQQFTTSTKYTAANAFDSKKADIAKALNIDAANISTITATQQNIVITFTNAITVTAETTGVVSAAAVNNVTLKATANATDRTITLVNNTGDNVFTEPSDSGTPGTGGSGSGSGTGGSGSGSGTGGSGSGTGGSGSGSGTGGSGSGTGGSGSGTGGSGSGTGGSGSGTSGSGSK